MMRSGHGELRKSIVQDSSRACAFPGFSERLSPLLLCSEKAFARLFDNKKEAVSLHDLIQFARSMGLSRHVLISRLSLIRAEDPNRFRFSRALRNVVVGLAVWNERGATVRKWPPFRNFDRDIEPAFLRRVVRQDFTPEEAFLPDQAFAMTLL